MQKILLLRKGERYVSKGNYNLTRIRYLASLFPDALFLLPIRHPMTHVQSLTRQHRLFCRYAAQDERVGPYLRAVGHYEFGPGRAPIFVDRIGTARTLEFWSSGNDSAGYAQQWSDLYGHVLDMLRSERGLQERVRLVRFEDLTADPARELAEVLAFTQLGDREAAGRLAAGIAEPSLPDGIDAGAAECWQIVESVASAYGYTMNLRDLRPCELIPPATRSGSSCAS
jgi:hypothetical protein